MKKFLALLLSLMLVLSLAACGDTADDTTDEDTPPTEDTDTDADTNTDGEEVEGRINDDELARLTEAYNAVAVPYNEIATMVNENGWMADEQTNAEMTALQNTLGFIGTGLTEDISMLDGSDFEALIDSLTDEQLPSALDELRERVSVPYEG